MSEDRIVLTFDQAKSETVEQAKLAASSYRRGYYLDALEWACLASDLAGRLWNAVKGAEEFEARQLTSRACAIRNACFRKAEAMMAGNLASHGAPQGQAYRRPR